MKAWKIERVEVEKIDATLLSDAELIGLSILAAQNAVDLGDSLDVYGRAWTKIQPQVKIAIKARK